MTAAVFYAVVACQLINLASLLLSIARPDLRLWPPPDAGTRRHALTRFLRPLGPLATVGLFVVGALDFGSFSGEPWLRYSVGGVLLAPGGVLALWGALGLGLDASTGAERDLMAVGAYRYSRNPQYVGSIAAMLGYALICASELALILWGLWTIWFMLAPFAEEPWLKDKLGVPYREYVTQVRRYL